MPSFTFIWDNDRNVPHLAEHAVTPEEAAFIVENATDDERGFSQTTGNPIAFGDTPAGRHLMVVYWFIDEMTVYVETAYDVPRCRSLRRPRKPRR